MSGICSAHKDHVKGCPRCEAISTLTLSSDHKYTLDGKVIPGVTEIIGQYIRQGEWYINVFTGTAIPAYVMHDAQDRGKAIHKAIFILLHEKKLDLTVIHPSLVAPITAFNQWVKYYQPKIEIIEEPTYSELYQYGGQPDLICRIKGVLSIVEYKTSEAAASMAGPQTAAYEYAFCERHTVKGKMNRYVLVLPESGRGSFEQLTSKDDWNFFKARLYQFNYLRGKK